MTLFLINRGYSRILKDHHLKILIRNCIKSPHVLNLILNIMYLGIVLRKQLQKATVANLYTFKIAAAVTKVLVSCMVLFPSTAAAPESKQQCPCRGPPVSPAFFGWDFTVSVETEDPCTQVTTRQGEIYISFTTVFLE